MTIQSMIIGGLPAATETTFDVINPATGQVFAEAPDCSLAQLDSAFEAAAQAFATWRKDEDSRRALMLKLAEAIIAHGDELTDLMVMETGKPWSLANLEVTATRLWLEYYAAVEIPRTILADDEAARIELAHRPLGVVAAIVPWNFPIATLTTKIVPALRVGNTVVAKPSPFTPIASLRYAEILNEILPAGVVTVVTGGDELGAAMTSHPVPRKITFTGSIEAGMHVARSAADDLKRVTLELGGNDAAIILDDAELDAVVPAVLERAFFNCGQTCAVPKRIYAPASQYDDIVDAFAAAAGSYTLGAGHSGTMGPLSTRPQYERIAGLVDDAITQGLKPVTGGRPVDQDGFFYEPTILAAAYPGIHIVDEEQFGPALPIIPYDGTEDAIRQANDTMFGLCGSVWTSDPERGQTIAEQLECGVTYVNAHGVHRPSAPMLGVKHSGLGVESGIEGMLEHTDPQVIYVASQVTSTALT